MMYGSPADQETLVKLKMVIPKMTNWSFSADAEYMEKRKADLATKHGKDSPTYKVELEKVDPYYLRNTVHNYTNQLAITSTLDEFEAKYNQFENNVLKANKNVIPNAYKQYYNSLKADSILTVEDYKRSEASFGSYVNWLIFGASSIATLMVANQISKTSSPVSKASTIPVRQNLPPVIAGIWAAGWLGKTALIGAGLGVTYGTYKAVDFASKEAISVFLLKDDVIDPKVLKERTSALEKKIDKGDYYSGSNVREAMVSKEVNYPGTSMGMCSAGGQNTELQAKFALTFATYLSKDKSYLGKAKKLSFRELTPQQIQQEMASIQALFQQSSNQVVKEYSAIFANLASSWCLEESESFLEKLNDSIYFDAPSFCKDVKDSDHLIQVLEGLFAGGDTPCRYAKDLNKWKKIKLSVYTPLALGGLYLSMPIIKPVFSIVGSLLEKKADDLKDRKDNRKRQIRKTRRRLR